MNTPRSAPTASTTAALTAAQDAAQDAASTTAAQTAIDASCCGESSKPQSPLPPEPRLNLPAPEVGEVVASAALLADSTRAGILRMLADGPMCVCEMAAALGERQNNVSNHLARLREAGLVRAVRHSGDARWMFYERDDERCAATAAALTELLR